MNKYSSRRAKACAIPSYVKQTVYNRDSGRCVYCGRPGLPEAHYIPRSKGGLGVQENVLTLCRPCHDRFDNGDRQTREGMREFFREYLMTQYPEWDEEKLIYRRYT